MTKDENGKVTCTHNHTDVEDNRAVFLPFNQIFGGWGWGVKGIDLYNQDVKDITPGKEHSVVKFNAKVENNSYFDNETTYMIGDLFETANGVLINNPSVMVSITSVETNEVAGTYTQDASDWTKGTISFKDGFEGLVKITIQDYQFCTPTTLYVYVSENLEILDAIVEFNKETGNTNVGRINFNDFVSNEREVAF